MSDPSGSLAPDYLHHWQIAPLPEGGRLRVLTAAHPPDHVLDDLRWTYRVEPECEIVAPEVLEVALHSLDSQIETAATLIAALEPAPSQEPEYVGEGDVLAQSQEAPVIRLVNLLLLEALEARASDLHLEAGRDRVQVRYRVDGVLLDAPAPPAQLVPAVIGRLKVMAELDVAERRRPQDGRIRLRLAERLVDVRVSTLPTLHGESVVLRLLESEGRRLGLSDLGMGEDTRRQLSELLSAPHGVLLTTGPTGSGKTTTLYAALEQIRSGREKIVTVEDPVEYALGGVAQVPVNRKAGVTFASALRSILRQDPDVILVGEMRDTETAEICVQAALTGHLVLSTLHTNDAPGALVRLLDLQVEPYLVASTVEGVLAQRLVRVICRVCARPAAVDREVEMEMSRSGFGTERVLTGAGCPECRGTGYRGRTGIYELLIVDEAIRAEVLKARGASALRAMALEAGMRPLRSDGWRQVANGVTTPAEVLRVSR